MMAPRSQEQEVAEVALEPRLVRFPALQYTLLPPPNQGDWSFLSETSFFPFMF